MLGRHLLSQTLTRRVLLACSRFLQGEGTDPEQVAKLREAVQQVGATQSHLDHDSSVKHEPVVKALNTLPHLAF